MKEYTIVVTEAEVSMLRLVLAKTSAQGPDAARLLVGLADKLPVEPTIEADTTK